MQNILTKWVGSRDWKAKHKKQKKHKTNYKWGENMDVECWLMGLNLMTLTAQKQSGLCHSSTAACGQNRKLKIDRRPH